MGRSKQHGVTLQHTQYADEIVAWLKLTGAPPLEIGVVEEIRDRLKEHAKNGAIVRVRLKNRGSPMVAGRIRFPAPTKMIDSRQHGPGFLWSVEEMDVLSRMCRELAMVEEMRERLPHRSETAIRHQLQKMGLKARVPRTHGDADPMRTRDGRGVLSRARELRARRVEEHRDERESA